MKKFYLGSHTVEDVTFLKVSGVIDEDNTLANSLRRIEGRTVVIDLSGVERINSCGVRDWVNWLNDLESRGRQVVLVRCSPCIVNQINLVHNFTGNALVKSFFAPYYCTRCDSEQLKLLQVESFAGSKEPHAPSLRGDGCNQMPCELAFDDIEASYFAFLPRSGGKVDDRLQKLVETFSPSIKERIKRLDVVEQASSEATGTPVSAQYSPLTVTTTGVSIGRDSVNRQPPAAPTPPERPATSRATAILLTIALALVGGIIAYVVLYLGEK